MKFPVPPCVLGASAVNVFWRLFTAEDAEAAEIAQRNELRHRLFDHVVDQLPEAIADYWISLGNKNAFKDGF